MSLQFPKTEGRLDAMIEGGEVVTPDDNTDLARYVTGINVGTTGPVRMTLLDGSVVTLTLAAGAIHRIIAKRIHSTGTNAGTIYGLY